MTGCEITGFPAFRDTQKHCRKAIFLTRISERKPCKNQNLGKPNLAQGFPSVFGKPERAAESQFLEVAFRKEIQLFFLISHPGHGNLKRDLYKKEI